MIFFFFFYIFILKLLGKIWVMYIIKMCTHKDMLYFNEFPSQLFAASCAKLCCLHTPVPRSQLLLGSCHLSTNLSNHRTFKKYLQLYNLKLHLIYKLPPSLLFNVGEALFNLIFWIYQIYTLFPSPHTPLVPVTVLGVAFLTLVMCASVCSCDMHTCNAYFTSIKPCPIYFQEATKNAYFTHIKLQSSYLKPTHKMCAWSLSQTQKSISP